MKTITKSVIKLSELPKQLQNDKIFDGHKMHSYAEYHIDDSEKDELSIWLIENYPTIKRKISFLIHIDIDIEKETLEVNPEMLSIEWQSERSYSEEEVLRILQECKSYLSFGDEFDEIEWFEQFKK